MGKFAAHFTLLWKDELNPRVRCALGNVFSLRPSLSPQKRVHAGMANQHLSPSVTHGNTALHLCSYVLNELSINSTKRVEEDDVGRKIVFWSVTQIREVGEAVICILRP